MMKSGVFTDDEEYDEQCQGRYRIYFFRIVFLPELQCWCQLFVSSSCQLFNVFLNKSGEVHNMDVGVNEPAFCKKLSSFNNICCLQMLS
jgi:hypothetical protein